MENTDVKPKKVLTEAQRLAFLKGREKRLANIETKKMEKLEALQNEKQEEKIEEIQEKNSKPVPPKAEPKTEEPPPPVPTATPVPDIDDIVERVMSKLKSKEEVDREKMPPPPPKPVHKRPYARRQTVSVPREPTTPETTPPPNVQTRDFNWM